MKTIKVSTWKHPDMYAYEENQNYLRAMHSQGKKITKINIWGTYIFEECTPEDVIYQIDCNPNGRKNKEEYLQMFNDCGWEHIFSKGNFHYFRKSASLTDGNESIFCDEESRRKMRNRVKYSWIIYALTFTVFYVLGQIIWNPILGNSESWAEAFKTSLSPISIGAVILGFLLGTCILVFRRRKWRNGRMYTKTSKMSKPVKIILGILGSLYLIATIYLLGHTAFRFIVPKVVDLPSVQSIRYTPEEDAQPISLKAIGEYFLKNQSIAMGYYENYKKETDKNISFEQFCAKFELEDATFSSKYDGSLTYSGIHVINKDNAHLNDHDFKITLSNGEYFEGNACSGGGNIYSGDMFDLDLTTYISRDAYKEAVEQNARFVNVKVIATVKFDRKFDTAEDVKETETFNMLIPVTDVVNVEKYIDSMEILSALPETGTVHEYIDVNGTEIKYTLYDGTEKTDKIKYGNFLGSDYMLGDMELICSTKDVNDENGNPVKRVYTLSYCDSSVSFDVNLTNESQFREIEITDYNYGVGIFGDTRIEVSYNVMYTDGTMESFDGDCVLFGSKKILGSARGYTVFVDLKPYGNDSYVAPKNTACFSLNIGNVSDFVEFEYKDK